MDMTATILPKSSQTNADDLLGEARTITITAVKANPSGPEQPVAVSYVGDDGRPYMPCKSMRRVMVHAWGKDAANYVGRSMTLYCDPEVVFGGMKVGGIRISHLSHIDRAVTMALTATRGSKKPFTVKPLAQAEPARSDAMATVDALREGAPLPEPEDTPPHIVEWVNKQCVALRTITAERFNAWLANERTTNDRAGLRENYPALSAQLEAGVALARNRLNADADELETGVFEGPVT